MKDRKTVTIREYPPAVTRDGWGSWVIDRGEHGKLHFTTWEAAEEHAYRDMGIEYDNIVWVEDPTLQKIRETPATIVHVSVHRGRDTDIAHRKCGERADNAWEYEDQRARSTQGRRREELQGRNCTVCGKPLLAEISVASAA